MTVAEDAVLVNKQGIYTPPQSKIGIMVVIKDIRHEFGCTRQLVVPVNGNGEAWVDSSRVKISEG